MSISFLFLKELLHGYQFLLLCFPPVSLGRMWKQSLLGKCSLLHVKALLPNSLKAAVGGTFDAQLLLVAFSELQRTVLLCPLTFENGCRAYYFWLEALNHSYAVLQSFPSMAEGNQKHLSG